MESECASGEAVQRGVALLLGCFGGWARRSSRVSDDCVSAGEKPLGKNGLCGLSAGNRFETLGCFGVVSRGKGLEEEKRLYAG